MTSVFWTILALDAILLLGLLVATLTQSGSPDGGREMALAFSVVLPAIVIAAAALVFRFSTSPAWRMIALIVVAGPGLLLIGVRIRSAWIDWQVHQLTLGRGYFTGSRMKQLGAAVVRGDTAALVTLAPGAEINAPGESGMTLMRLAVEGAAGTSPGQEQTRLPVIRTLLSLGARPEPGLETATKVADPVVLRTLLDAGADPNFREDAEPIVFEWLRVMPLENLRLLADHCADLSTQDRLGEPLAVRIAEEDRWDLLALLIERGARVGQADRGGRTARAVVEDRIASAGREGRQVPDALARIKALLDGVPPGR